MTLARILRAAAVAIVLLAILDPALTSGRRVPAEVAVVRGPAAEAHGDLEADYEAVFATVSERFDAVGGPWPGAAATVLVGRGLPAGADALPEPLFRVVPTQGGPQTRILRFDLPARVPLEVTVRGVVFLVPPRAGPAPVVDVVLLDDTRELDRARALSVEADAGVLRADVTFVPTRPGVQTLTVALLDGEGEPRRVLRRVVEVHERRWPALFLDSRPSWPSTFARRALDQDPRFELSGRIETSPGLATTFGEPPANPDAPGALDAYDVVVVGAPDGLSPARAEALDRWVRLGGGTLVLLPDAVAVETGSAALWHELAGTDAWEERVVDAEVPVTTTEFDAALDTAALPLFQSRMRLLPRALPRGARVLARDPQGSPVVWERPLGLGTVVVSGAVDAWQFRDPERSGFEAGWRSLMARAAAGRAPPLELQLDPGGHPTRSAPPFGPPIGGGMVVPAGAEIRLQARTRDAMGPLEPGDSVSFLATASLVHESGAVLPLSVWPGRDPLSFEGRFRAPARPGSWRVTLEVDAHLASVPLVVDAATTALGGSGEFDDDLVEAWVQARGGTSIESDRLDDLVDALETRLGVERRREPWHPMRSPWWMLPFTLALAGEWWLRRRQGLP